MSESIAGGESEEEKLKKQLADLDESDKKTRAALAEATAALQQIEEPISKTKNGEKTFGEIRKNTKKTRKLLGEDFVAGKPSKPAKRLGGKPLNTSSQEETINSLPPEAETVEEEAVPAVTEAAQEAEIKKEIEALPKAERQGLGKFLNTIGFRVEKNKNNFLVEFFEKRIKTGDTNGTTNRLLKAARNSYKKAAEAAEKKLNAKDPGTITKISNYAYLAKNFLRPARLIMDLTGISPGGIQRVLMAGGMLTAQLSGIAKEARFLNEEVLEKTRIDVDRATDEAWRIYERAQTRAGTTGNVSADELKTAYLHEIPKDLQERLKNTTVANGMIQKLFRKHLEFDINRLNKDVANAKTAGKKEQLLRRWEKRLTDYDRVLTQVGTVDELAMFALYAETTSQNIVRGLTLQTLYLLPEKIWESIAHTVGNTDSSQVIDLMPDSTTAEIPDHPFVGPIQEHPSAQAEVEKILTEKVTVPEVAPVVETPSPSEISVATPHLDIVKPEIESPELNPALGLDRAQEEIEKHAALVSNTSPVSEIPSIEPVEITVKAPEGLEVVDPGVEKKVPESILQHAEDQIKAADAERAAEAKRKILETLESHHTETANIRPEIPSIAQQIPRQPENWQYEWKYNGPAGLIDNADYNVGGGNWNSPEISMEINHVYDKNMINIFPEDVRTSSDFTETFAKMENRPAKNLLKLAEKNRYPEGENIRLIEFFKKIRQTLGPGFKPTGGILRREETTEHFVRRALNEAARQGPAALERLKV